VGKFESLEYEKQTCSFISSHHLEKEVSFLGVLTGNAKYSTYRSADIFCFPTFFASEGFSVVLLEAMSFSLPVVTTDWRGLKSIVAEGESGFLVPIHDAKAVANRLSRLIDTPRLREEMGSVGRRRYEERFTAEVYHRNFQQVFSAAAEMLLAGRSI
jgi:glycosyltransferase involved in cell wall biosynthesis